MIEEKGSYSDDTSKWASTVDRQTETVHCSEIQSLKL